jgi:hypothetical protein
MNYRRRSQAQEPVPPSLRVLFVWRTRKFSFREGRFASIRINFGAEDRAGPVARIAKSRSVQRVETPDRRDIAQQFIDAAKTADRPRR